jgi:hypothetical protein
VIVRARETGFRAAIWALGALWIWTKGTRATATHSRVTTGDKPQTLEGEPVVLDSRPSPNSSGRTLADRPSQRSTGSHGRSPSVRAHSEVAVGSIPGSVSRRRRTGSPAPQTFGTKTHAGQWLAAAQVDQLRGVWVDPRAGRLTLTEWSEGWLAHRRLRPRTEEPYRHLLRLHILRSLGRTELSRLTPSAIRGWYASLAEAHPSTAAKAYRLLRAMMNTAVADELIARNPCRVDGAGVERTPERPIPTVAEVAALCDAMPERWRLLVLLAAWCGLRRGELLALQRRDLDGLRNTVGVQRTHQYMLDGRILEGPPKTEAGRRLVAIPPHLGDDIAAHLARFVAP